MIQLNLSAPPSLGPDFCYLASAGAGPVLGKAMHQQFGKNIFFIFFKSGGGHLLNIFETIFFQFRCVNVSSKNKPQRLSVQESNHCYCYSTSSIIGGVDLLMTSQPTKRPQNVCN